MKIVVADLYQLQRVGGKFSTEHKTLLHPSQKILSSYVDEVNSNSAENGRLYVINEQATKENQKAREEHLKALEMREEASKITPEAILGAISNSAKTVKAVKVVKVVKDENDEKTKLAPRRATKPE